MATMRVMPMHSIYTRVNLYHVMLETIIGQSVSSRFCFWCSLICNLTFYSFHLWSNTDGVCDYKCPGHDAPSISPTARPSFFPSTTVPNSTQSPASSSSVSCTFTNGTKGVKCNPIDACAGINTEYISCGSCIGEASCLFTGGSIGESSCIGRRSCFSVLGDVDQLSCTGNFACYNHQCEYNLCSSL